MSYMSERAAEEEMNRMENPEVETQEPPKEKTRIELLIEQHSKVIALLEMLAEVFPEDVNIGSYEERVTLWPINEETSRHYMGLLLRMFPNTKPTVTKPYDTATDLQAIWKFTNGTNIRLAGYKPRTCKLVKKTIVHPAKPEEIIPAKPERVEEIEELSCDLGDGDVNIGEAK